LVELLSAARGDPTSVLGDTAVLVVDALAGRTPTGWAAGAIPVVVVGVADDPASIDPSPYDVLLAPRDPMLAALLEEVGRHPIAAAALAVLLRDSDRRPVEAGLAAESAVYSTLQAGPEFAEWRRRRLDEPLPPDPAPPVIVERVGDELHVVLNRPHRHNAVTTGLRDAHRLYHTANVPSVQWYRQANRGSLM
jgi:hypothetical protein